MLAEVFRISFSNVSKLGGGSGQSLTVVTRIDRGAHEIAIYLIAAPALVVASLAINLLLRSQFGLGLTALRDREAAAENLSPDRMSIADMQIGSGRNPRGWWYSKSMHQTRR